MRGLWLRLKRADASEEELGRETEAAELLAGISDPEASDGKLTSSFFRLFQIEFVIRIPPFRVHLRGRGLPVKAVSDGVQLEFGLAIVSCDGFLRACVFTNPSEWRSSCSLA